MCIGKVIRPAAVLTVLLALTMPRNAAARPGPGEDPQGVPAPLTLAGAGRQVLRDAGRIWSAPARLRAADVVPLLAFAATASFLIAVDEEVRAKVQGYAEGHPWVDDVGPALSRMGDVGVLAVAGGFYGAGLIFKDARARNTGFLAANAVLQNFLVVNVLKGLTGRQRPCHADGVDLWSGPVGFFGRFKSGSNSRYLSFPSGHTSTAFSMAAVVALRYPRPIWVPILAYTLASGVGLSMMTEDHHWVSDVFCGAVIGHMIGRLVVRSRDRRQRLVPSLACSRRGIFLSLSYDLGPAGP
jgi:membrane-associated phospholipid phosphatase